MLRSNPLLAGPKIKKFFTVLPNLPVDRNIFAKHSTGPTIVRPRPSRSNMASTEPTTTAPDADSPRIPCPLEGLIAVNKPTGISSAEVLRRLQAVFKPSASFGPTLALEHAKRANEPGSQNRRRRGFAKKIEVKIGHGGTLDPMASGVLIAGIGAGTKMLGSFLGCTKTYEAVLILGAETDTYDACGKVTRWAGWEGVTREKVEEALKQFRGEIWQRPPIYSALHMNGKRLYEYAREGKPLPVEIAKRKVSTLELEIVDFQEPEEHNWAFPKEEAPKEEMVLVDMVEKGATELRSEDVMKAVEANKKQEEAKEEVKEEVKEEANEEVMETTDEAVTAGTKRARSPTSEDLVNKKQKAEETTEAVATETASKPASGRPTTKPPAITLRMTVTSGFYVRSLVHDLGQALGSAAHMVKLTRTRQSEFEIGTENVIEWEDLVEKPEEVWGPKVQKQLVKWMEERDAKMGR